MKLGKCFKTVLLCGAFLAALLTGCAQKKTDALPKTVPETPAPYAVRFENRGLTLSMQLVLPGEYPQVPQMQMEGYVFSHWVNDRGIETDPTREKISADTVYTAAVYPDLSKNAPYLFGDENGFLLPDAPLTGAALARALEALAVRQEALELVVFDTQAAAFTSDLLAQTLGMCFPAARVAAEFEGFTCEVVSRRDFARIMNGLLGRNQAVRAAREQPLFKDVALTQENEDLLLSCACYEADPEGQSLYLSLLQDRLWQPGFTLLEGFLYYADETGKVLADGKLGKLAFGADGRYTCGDPELDLQVAALIKDFMTANPKADREDLLMAAFVYARDSFEYVNRGVLIFRQTGWEKEKAKQMLATGSGNCYNYAAVFWALARGLGYEAVGYSGRALSDGGPHAWVQIKMEGQNYIFDPQLARREKDGQRSNYGEDMFRVSSDIWYMWRYVK